MSATELTAVPITREGLLKLQKRKTLALAIIDLLSRDLDTLVKMFLQLIKDIEKLRNDLYETLHDAYESCSEAKMIIGTRRFEQLILEDVEDVFDVEVGEKRLAGVRLINVSIPYLNLIEKNTIQTTYNILDTSAKLDEAISRMRKTLKMLVKLAEAEATINTVARAMQITRKKINMIQYRFIPDIDRTMRYIESILEERAREDTIRIRILQKKRKAY
ncbi:MAG: V-type ATP synthase subunit D [Nitrososphaerota archaeon]|nr:V-type ATP synthase subunit D [Candidatus Bathyarchaeota archaeon]MCX8162160.1 V-type ATP synthase subunit D [Candidatus Bathyarchaeota archaeon]MDW8061565.1 V-type ATP synthase subunit D [Nitrososphaerota archaeon]